MLNNFNVGVVMGVAYIAGPIRICFLQPCYVISFVFALFVNPARACASRGLCDWTKKKLNCTLAIDSPFQTFAVGLLVKLID